MMQRRPWFGKVMGAGLVALAATLLLGQSVLAAGIRVVPSVSRVLPGEDFAVDIVAENIPVADGLGAVQFRLNVAAPGAKVTGVADLTQAATDSVAVATPLLISVPTATRSGLGAFFLPPTQGSGGILVMDNESLQNGTALYTYAHTHGASRPAGTGSIARFQVRVGSAVAAEAITFTLDDVLLLDGGPAYPLDSNVGATVTLRCTSTVPALTGKSLAQAQAALTQAGLALGNVYEIDNAGGTQPLGVVLEQSALAGSELDCDATVNLAINNAPVEVTGLIASDRAGDDTGRVRLNWSSSTSNDTAGYRIYSESTRLLDLTGAQVTTAEVGGLPVGIAQTLRITAVDGHGNESAGVTVSVTAVDDIPPQVTISGVTDGIFYREAVTPQVSVIESNLANQTLTLNGQPYVAGTPIAADGSYTLTVTATDIAGQTVTVSRSFMIDRTAPVTAITVGTPQFTDAAGNLYVTAETPVTADARDAGAGVALIETRLDNGPWLPYAPLTIAEEGPHRLAFRGTDALGNREAEQVLPVIVDTWAPEATLTVGAPSVTTSDGRLFVTSSTSLTIESIDDWVGVAETSYRLDNGSCLPAMPFTIATEGEHRLEFHGKDLLGHAGTPQTQLLSVDNTAPTTRILFSPQSFVIEETLLVAPTTEVTLVSEDSGVGSRTTLYRIDDESDWRSYAGPFSLAQLAFGTHTIHFTSEDLLGNRAAEQSITVTLAEATVDVTVLNVPRVLVWTEDPAAAKGSNAQNNAVAEVQSLVNQALGAADAYVRMVTDKDAFQRAFRSGLYNVVMILNQDVPFNADFLRELREAVAQGHIGLLVSSWGNNVHPILQDLFGLDFAGSMSMNEAQRPLTLFDSPVSVPTDLSTSGRILKTRLAGGTLAGIVPGDSQCSAVRSVSFRYPVEVKPGARVSVSAATVQGKKRNLVDEEQGSVTALPMDGINTVTGNPAGDVAIDGVTADGVSFTLAAPYGSLGANYRLAVKVEHADGSVSQSGDVTVTPTCAANLVAGVKAGPYQILSADVDQVKTGDDLPAAVLNQYGAGRTAFLAYNLLESALESGNSAHVELLGKAAGYLLPEIAEIEPAGIALVETSVSLAGTTLDVTAKDTLGAGLEHLPLFDLTQEPLEYRFHLTDGETATYRYFVRVPDRAGEYQKETALSMNVEGISIPYDRYMQVFTLSTDSADLLQQAVFLVEELEQRHPEAGTGLSSIDVNLKAIALLPKATADDFAAVISATLQTINSVQALPFVTDELQTVLGRYLRIMEAKQAMLSERG